MKIFWNSGSRHNKSNIQNFEFLDEFLVFSGCSSRARTWNNIKVSETNKNANFNSNACQVAWFHVSIFKNFLMGSPSPSFEHYWDSLLNISCEPLVRASLNFLFETYLCCLNK